MTPTFIYLLNSRCSDTDGTSLVSILLRLPSQYRYHKRSDHHMPAATLWNYPVAGVCHGLYARNLSLVFLLLPTRRRWTASLWKAGRQTPPATFPCPGSDVRVPTPALPHRHGPPVLSTPVVLMDFPLQPPPAPTDADAEVVHFSLRPHSLISEWQKLCFKPILD